MIKIATVFSGIGAFEQAAYKFYGKENIDLVFAADNGERELEVDNKVIQNWLENKSDKKIQLEVKKKYDSLKKKNYVKETYFRNYDIKEEQWYEDIRFIDGNKYRDKVDILVGGSPCQSFSVIGKRAGLEDTRGTLFYDFARLVSEIQPKVFIFENVMGMLSHDGGNTWEIIQEVFRSLGYKFKDDVLNSKYFGIPQDRRRLFVVGFKDHNKGSEFEFPKGFKLSKTLWDYVENKVPAKYYMGQKGFEFVTNPKYKNRARVNRKVIQTQKANQQFNWNGDFIFEELDDKKHNDEILSKAYIGKYKDKTGVIRKLTHRECLRLMGFDDSFILPVPDMQGYRQVGNSIVVNVLVKILEHIEKVKGLE